MNVFVLCTGRCGSLTFFRACQHIDNFSAGHETHRARIGNRRMDYPPDHIETDNRLSWFLGRLDSAFGNTAFYVHLTRDADKVASSFQRRWNQGIIEAYASGILMAGQAASLRDRKFEICLDYCHTVEENIKLFLKDKAHKMNFPIEQAASVFPEFWQRIEARGDFSSALAEFEQMHNASS